MKKKAFSSFDTSPSFKTRLGNQHSRSNASISAWPSSLNYTLLGISGSLNPIALNRGPSSPKNLNLARKNSGEVQICQESPGKSRLRGTLSYKDCKSPKGNTKKKRKLGYKENYIQKRNAGYKGKTTKSGNKRYQEMAANRPSTVDHLSMHEISATSDILKRLPSISLLQIHKKSVVLPILSPYKKTLVIDLDETLVHCCEKGELADVYLPIAFGETEKVLMGINIRPYLQEFLNEVRKNFEVVVFTASQKNYADAVLDHIDPFQTLIDKRLYRDSCIEINGVFFKDLRILYNRQLKDIVIVDNLALSFAYQFANGVPFRSWYSDRNDQELLKLIDYLAELVHVDDVRPVNLQTFQLDTCYQDYLAEIF